MVRTLLLFSLESLPAVVFYVVSHWLNFMQSTVLYVAITLPVVIISLYCTKRLPYLSLIFGVVIISAGLATVHTGNPQILILSDSLYFFGGAGALLWSLTTHTTILERLFRHTFALTSDGWRILTWQWVLIFLAAGLTNELVRFVATPEWWIGFQFWRSGLITVISLGQFFVTHRYRIESESARWGIRLRN